MLKIHFTSSTNMPLSTHVKKYRNIKIKTKMTSCWQKWLIGVLKIS